MFFITKKEIEKKQNKKTHPLKQLLIIFSACSTENPNSPKTTFDFPKYKRKITAAIDNKTTKNRKQNSGLATHYGKHMHVLRKTSIGSTGLMEVFLL